MSDNTPQKSFVGTTIGKYIIEEEVGRGGQATVYRGRDRHINRIVAVKMLPPHLMQDPNFFERFKREIDVITRLEHPHILPIYDYGRTPDGIPFIIMRYMGGGSLEKLIPVEQVHKLELPLNQIGQALDYAHRHNIIHRDLKPGNILMDEEGNAYLTDFGIARVIDSKLTGADIVGTPHYMSPEQISGEPVDGRSDVFSLGIVLYELISGNLPYQDQPITMVLVKRLQEDTPSVQKARGNIPITVSNVISRATSRRPEERYPTAGEMVKAFSRALHETTQPTPDVSRIVGVRSGLSASQAGTGRFESSMALSLIIEGYDPLRVRFFMEQPSFVFGRSNEEGDEHVIDLVPFGGFEAGVSRRHAVITFDEERSMVSVKDLGSSNGTYINDVRLNADRPYQLHNGDTLRLSKLPMAVVFDIED